jgi:hypothetical protein
MDAEAAVKLFIKRIIAKQKRPRYSASVERDATRKKFLDALDHDLAWHVDEMAAVQELSDEEWNSPAYRYASDGAFGEDVGTLREGYEHASPHGGWLLIGQSGDVAIYRPEDRVDDELFFRL